jgi:hypothetical protein
MNVRYLLAAVSLACASGTQGATVLSTASIYNTGTGSTQRTTFDLNGATAITIAATGSVVLTPPYANNPDGEGSFAIPHNVLGANGLSGISLPSGRAGALVGVFLGATDPGSGAIAPASLSYMVSDLQFASFSPLLAQVFFVGDGLMGAGTGASQIFYAPVGATRIAFGIADAENYQGDPGAYYDNSRSYEVGIKPLGAVVPEPATWAMMILGFAVIGASRRRRPVVRAAAI